MIYLLSDGWHDEYNIDVIEGTEVENWQDLCISLIDQSVKDLLDENDNFVEPDTKNMTDEEFDNASLCPTHICMSSIKDKILEKLSKLGYRLIEPDNVFLYGTISIYSKDKDKGTMPYAELINRKGSISINQICKLEDVLQEETKERLLSYVKRESIF